MTTIQQAISRRRFAAFAVAVAAALQASPALAVPLRIPEARITLEVPQGWETETFNVRSAQVHSSTGIRIEVLSPPPAQNVQQVLDFQRSSGDMHGLTWSAVQPVTAAGLSGSTQRATGAHAGVPTTFVQTWLTLRNRQVVFTASYPVASAATDEPIVLAFINSLRRAR